MVSSLQDYRVEEILFSNGRTRIMRAIRQSDEARVILKQLEDEFPEPGQLSRFSFSYDVLGKFDHPNITKALGWIKGDKSPTMILEDNDSIDLLNFLKSFPNEQLPVEEFLNIAIQLSDALSVIHHAQVIHKDLHPGNVLINPQTQQVQIIDFGLASLLSREQPALEAPEKLEGVLAYISPEQTGRMNRALDYRTDFYTLGVTFYRLLTGDVPFHGEDALGLVHAHIAKTQVPVAEIRDDVPVVLSQIIDKLLNKSAEDRYQSAMGLSKDLQRCRGALVLNKPLPEFALALDDIPDRFQVPQKLYGRQDEVNLLLRRFFQAASGTPKMLAIAGYSGIGKSALVHEVHKPIASHHGLFIAGKFDQFQRNIPYSALRQALKTWLQHSISLSEQKLAEQRERLIQVLGDNARVLIDFMPEFSHILGDMPPVASLGADETKNRFHNVFQQFVKTITSQRPLVVFIDDIQWADRGTLDLLPVLVSESGSRLLVVVAYRENEVNPQHPAIKTLAGIEESPVTTDCLSYINLGPLSIEQVSELLQDALYRPHRDVIDLADLIHKKTAGNPFFIGEFLKTLYTDGLLNFNLQQQRWCWDMEEISARGITDNVVDLMLAKMQQLPAATQALIQLAACVGSRFDLEMLAVVAGSPLIKVTREIWPALKDGLLIQDGGDWFLGMVQAQADSHTELDEAEQLLSQSSPLSPHCRFVHDRMLQAAYESMSESDRKETHLRIGRLLKAHADQQGEKQDIYAIVEQLNLGRSLITDQNERDELISLNISAAVKAHDASVWQAATEFSAVGIELLPDNAWITYHEDACRLYQIRAESEYLNGDPDNAEYYYKILFEHLDDGIAKAEICATRLIQTIGRGKWFDGALYAREGLRFLGLDIPLSQTDIVDQTYKEQALLDSRLGKVGIENLVDLPEMSEERLLIAIRIFPNLSQCSAIIGDNLLRDYCAIKGMNIILQHGKSDLAAMQMACYAFYLRLNERYLTAYEIGMQAKKITECYSFCREVSNCYNMLATTVFYLRQPLDDCIFLHEKGELLGLENGEIARASMNAANTLFCKLSQGMPLKDLKKHAADIKAQLIKRSVFHPVASIIEKFSAALLIGQPDAAHGLDEDRFDQGFDKVKSSFHYSYYTHYCAQLAFWCDQYDLALASAKKTRQQWDRMPSGSFSVDHLVIHGLLLVKRWHHLDESEKSYLLSCETQLKQFADAYEVNFSHKYLLLKAELMRYQRSPMESTIIYYRDAIDAAGRYGFIQYQALANELFSEYWLDSGFDVLSEPYVREALYLYQLWGCAPKVKRINSMYSRVLAASQKRVQRTYSRTDTISAKVDQALDMASVMKSAQHISSELRLEKLAVKVLQVIVECAGATSAALVFQDEGGVRLQALINERGEVYIPEEMPLLDKRTDLPINIVSYVLRSDEIVNLGDVLGERAFMDDPYVMQYQPRSILCMPVDYRDNTIGALYLENKLSIDTFTKDRLDVIKLLLSQAAISFENARLFTEVNELNQTLERKVEQRTADLAKANDHLSHVINELELTNEELNAFSYSVSHDLRSPLRALKGFSKILKDEYGEQFTPDSSDLLTRIIKSSNKMSDLIDGLLELSRMQRREISPADVDLSAMVADLFDEMQERYPSRDVVVKCAEGCIVRADERMIYAAVSNLVSNAWKYSSSCGKAEIEFGVNSYDGKEIPPGLGLVPDKLSIGESIYFIKDNGVGFDMNHADKLFSAFQRLHSEKQFSGTGIGLATVKRVIEKHGGSIWVNAREGKGATFYFILPG